MDSLQQTFNFSADDLAANRAGRITERQQRRINDQRATFIGIFAVGAIFILLGLTRLSTFPAGALLGFAAGIGIIAYGIRAWQRFNRILETPAEVRSVSGRAILNKQTSGNSSFYSVSVTGISLRLSRAQYAVLHDGADYHLYYSYRPIAILSVEPIDADDVGTDSTV